MVSLWTLRALAALGGGALGWWISLISELSTVGGGGFLPWGAALAGVGAAVGGGVAGFGLPALGRKIAALRGTAVVASMVGMLVGLAVASLVSIPLYGLEGALGWAVPVGVSLCLGAGGMWLGAQREGDVRALWPALDAGGRAAAARASGEGEGRHPATTAAMADLGAEAAVGREQRNGSILVDTSAIIDGRIADLTGTGFISGSLLVPRFVLDELRHIADSSDSLRRNRGRRGLDVLNRLRKDDAVPLRVLNVGVENGEEVDARLVELAREMKSSILTTDYNLNRVAEIQGVQVLNVNELANAVKSIVLPGENLRVDIVQEGKEAGQGVAYLDDGTMVVVEGGRRYINSSREVQVTRVLQTNAGRIVFAQPKTV